MNNLESVGMILAGVAATAVFDGLYIRHESQKAAEEHLAFLKANPAVAAVNATGLPLAPVFPQDPSQTPEALAAQKRKVNTVLLAVPALTMLAGLALARFTEHHQAGGAVVTVGLGGIAANVYLLLGGPLPGFGVSK